MLMIFTLFASCKAVTKEEFQITGNIDYVGDAVITISVPPLHYKYSPKKEYQLSPNNQGDFSLTIPSPNTDFIILSIDDQQLMLIADVNDDLRIDINRSQFPLNTNIKSNYIKDYSAYQQYLEEINGMDKAIEKQMNAFKAGEENEAISLSNKKVSIATSLLSNTKFEPLIDKAKGELLVNKIKSIEYRFNNSGFNADAERKAIIEEAKKNGFFTLKTLEAQRAGIRDITHYYARTFGIYDSVRNAESTSLAEIDIKRFGYSSLNEKRMELIKHIEDEDAQAYANMTLVAERIGEIDLKLAEPSYESYLEEFADYTEYVEFLKYFYNEVKSVSPGQKGIPFSLPDKDGQLFSLEDVSGKYVLLDFWAGWCQPCLDEFPEMRKIYADFSRNDFEIVGISNEIDKDVWRKDIQRFKNPWIQLYGGNGFEQETFKAYKGGGIPFYILLDREGNILRYNDIRATYNLREILEELIPE